MAEEQNLGVTKASIRLKIWDYIEENDLANFPRPVHHRIPNFKGAAAAAEKLKEMDIFQKARTIKVNPDKPQEHARFLILEANKSLLVPTPRLRTGLFNRITPPTNATKEQLTICSQSQGVKQFSKPIGLDDTVEVDLVIIGSVAVSPKGYRIGKGEGFADMEYAMMFTMGAVTKDTIVITTVHDCQVLDDIPEELMCPHDLMVDYILTPTQMIKCSSDDQEQDHINKPSGILWQMLSREKFKHIPILKTLRYREQKAGKDVRLKDEDEVPDLSQEMEKVRIRERKEPEQKASTTPRKHNKSRVPTDNSKKLFVGGLPRKLRVKDFKQDIRDKDVNPRYINWFGAKRFAFLQFTTDEEVTDALGKLEGITFMDVAVRVELCQDRPRNQSKGDANGTDQKEEDANGADQEQNDENGMEQNPSDASPVANGT